MPVEYMLPGGENPYVYVPIQPALKQCSISQAFWIKHFQCYEFKIALGQTQNVCSVLGVSKHSYEVQKISTLQSVQLALLCNASPVKEYGYKIIMQPLLQDLVHLEQTGMYIDQLGASVKGTVL